jgi:hypothetical protein
VFDFAKSFFLSLSLLIQRKRRSKHPTFLAHFSTVLIFGEATWQRHHVVNFVAAAFFQKKAAN